MDKRQAEHEIAQAVREIDFLRRSINDPRELQNRVDVVEARIRALKEVTGPRHIIGGYGRRRR